ncbi:MAG TPA: ASPIC/UnbV domain-containing protein, partial [Candidatus Krumholzibacteria bacterium]|nr:ASPIC/UnbV domain-containing protein [Candidatus Krumholzibacteria bacterium]
CTSTAQGRGVVCFDYDNDGDIDIFVSNYHGAPELWRNDSAPAGWIRLSLRGPHGPAIGARATIEAGGLTQTRELMCGNNYLSQNPTDIHVGLGNAPQADRIRVEWPNGQTTSIAGISSGQRVVFDQPPRSTPTPRALRIVNVSPNPFLDTATITLEGSPTRVAIYDVAGRLVQKLSPRSGTIQWNAENVPAGVYWIRINDQAASDARRIVLVR